MCLPVKVQSAPGGQIKGLIPLGMEMGSQKWDMGHEESGPEEYDPSLRGAEGVPLPTHPCRKKIQPLPELSQRSTICSNPAQPAHGNISRTCSSEKTGRHIDDSHSGSENSKP